jgi:hypothetical protein
MINPIFLVLLIPIAGYILLKSENVDFDKKKLYAGFFIILLLAITPSFSLQPAQADSSIKQIIKIRDIYPADSASASFVIDPPLTNVSKAFVILTVSHTGENDHSDTLKLVRILDENTLQLVGEDTATGNIAINFVATIIEYEGDIEVQHLEESVTVALGSPINFTIPNAVNITQSMIVTRFWAHNASETSIGSEEYTRIRILDSTTWEYQVAQAPNTEPQTQGVSIVEWNQNDIRVVRDIGTLTAEAGGQTATITPPSSIDPTRTILIFTFDNDEGTTIDIDDAGLQVSLTASGNIFLFRSDAEGNIDFGYELIEFPADMVKVTNFNTTLATGVLTTDVTVPEIKDYDKTMAMSSSAPIGGFSFGAGDVLADIAGAIDRVSSTFQIANNTIVTISRDDSTGEAVYGWQLIEFLERDEAENAQGTNTLRQIIKIEDTYTGATAFQDFTISPSLLTVNNTILFMSVEDASLDTADVSERLKRFGIIDTSTLRIHGSNDPLSTNTPINFTAYIVEFDQSSPIFVQRDQVQYTDGITTDELVMHMSPVNASGSHIQYNAWTSTNGDSTIGQEEFARVRILNDTTWGYQVELPSETQESVAVVNIIDWNQNNISVQRGQASLSGTTLSVSPPTDVIRNQTMLLVTHMTSNSEFEDEPDDSALFAHLDGSSPPDMVFERIDSADPALLINWQLISFPSDFANIQHLTHLQAIGTDNDTATITSVGNFSKSIAIGTSMSPMGFSNGKSSKTLTDSFGEAHGKVTLENATTVRFERGLSTGSWELGYQVIEFEPSVGAIFDQDILDVVTAIDLSQNKNITKLATDTVTSLDTVSTGVIFVVNLNDTGTATDVTAINVTKLNLDLVSALDNVDLTTTKGVIDSATILDQVSTEAIMLVLLTDLASTTDEVALAITKILADDVVTSDEINFVITKLLDDTVIVSDLLNATSTFGVDELDLVTANDLVILDITKQLTDVASTIDDLNLEPTKVFLDTTVVVDTTQADKDAGINATDSVGTVDNLVIDVTKLIQDVSTIQDNVVLLRILDLAINDTVTVNDPAIFFTISTNQTAGGSGSASTGGGVPTFERLVGLSILSELFNVVPKDNVPSDFVISTFGMMNTAVEISNIEPDQQFNTWFQFSTFPTTLRFDTEVDTSRTVNDPARFKNTALESFVLTVPLISCEGLDPFVTPVPCIDPLVYEIPIIFSITKGGVEFKEKHIVTVDATERIPCDIICEIVDFITQNYWWLAGILIVFMMMFFLRGAITKRGVRTARRVNKNHFTSFSANTPKRKFKRGKGR